jgi:hypothetical protein
VWGDQRAGDDIYGAIVDSTGNVTPAAGIAISTASQIQSNPKVVFGGGNYMVVWQDTRSGTSDIWGARVDTSGTVLDPTGFQVYVGAGAQITPAIAFEGAEYAVTWTDQGAPTNDIVMARVSTAGVVLDSPPIAVSTAAGTQQNPAACSGPDFLFAWTDNRNAVTAGDIYAARALSDGTVSDPSGIPVSTSANRQRTPSAAFDGTNFLVVWSDDRGDALGDIYGVRVNGTGTVLDPSGIAISTAQDMQRNPTAAFDGTNYFVVWEDRRNGVDTDLYGARINASGTLLDASGLTVASAPGDQTEPFVIFDGTNYFLVWSQTSAGVMSIYGARFAPAGTILPPGPILLSTSSSYQGKPKAAHGSSRYLVVWEKTDDLSGNLFAAASLIDATNGNVLTPAPGYFTLSGLNCCAFDPCVAFDGTNFFTSWSDSRNVDSDIYGNRVSTAGAPLDSTGIPLVQLPSSNQQYSAIAFDGTDYFLSWWDDRTRSQGDIYGSRMNISGTLVDGTSMKVSVKPESVSRPSLAQGGPGGDRTLIVYDGFVLDLFGTVRTLGAFFSRAASSYNIRRVDLPTELPPGTPNGLPPDAEFPVASFPFTDNVLTPAPEFRILFYQETQAGQDILAIKNSGMLQIDQKP